MWCLCPIPGWDLCACKSALVLDGCCDMQGVLGVLCNLVVLNLFFFWLTTPMRKWMFTQHERNTKCQICWSIHSTEYGSVYISLCSLHRRHFSLCQSYYKEAQMQEVWLSEFSKSTGSTSHKHLNSILFFLFCAPTHTLNLPFRFAAVRDYRRKDDLLCYAMYGLEAKSWCDLTARAQGDSFWLN